jgi:hypothetical protein
LTSKSAELGLDDRVGRGVEMGFVTSHCLRIRAGQSYWDKISGKCQLAPGGSYNTPLVKRRYSETIGDPSGEGWKWHRIQKSVGSLCASREIARVSREITERFILDSIAGSNLAVMCKWLTFGIIRESVTRARLSARAGSPYWSHRMKYEEQMAYVPPGHFSCPFSRDVWALQSSLEKGILRRHCAMPIFVYSQHSTT